MNYFSSMIENINPILSGHDTFPLRYGWIKKVYDQNVKNSDESNIFTQDSAIADFGVGKNMLNAMKFWSYHTGMIIRHKKHGYDNTNQDTFYHLDNYAKKQSDELIYDKLNSFYNSDTFFSEGGLDPYLESPSTIWLLHWTLATNPNLLTYYWLFNTYIGQQITREQIIFGVTELLTADLASYIKKPPSESTIKRDVDCFILNYTPKKQGKKKDIENLIDGPLAELNLISRINQTTFKLNRGKKSSLSLHIFVYCLVDFWKKFGDTADTLSIEMTTYDECSPGRIFMLDEDSIISYSEQLTHFDYPLTWVQSAGIKQFQLINGKSLDTLQAHAVDCIKRYDYLQS